MHVLTGSEKIPRTGYYPEWVSESVGFSAFALETLAAWLDPEQVHLDYEIAYQASVYCVRDRTQSCSYQVGVTPDSVTADVLAFSLHPPEALCRNPPSLVLPPYPRVASVRCRYSMSHVHTAQWRRSR